MQLPVSCKLCPRACGANRAAGEHGVCGADDTLRVARAALHAWEEPPISGWRGSGTVFFSNCPLQCVYCQNESISSGRVGKAIAVERLARIFLELQKQGAHNINLVTPTQYVPQITEALATARMAGLQLPVVYNTSGYETVETIEMLKGHVDIYLTDFKYCDPKLACRYSNAPDYEQLALRALRAMLAQVGDYTLGDEGILQRGVIVRHLLLPGQLGDSKAVVATVFSACKNRVCYSLMNQYTPLLGGGCERFAELGTTVSEADYSALIDFALGLGITNSFMQEGGTAEESFIPPFDLTGVEAAHDG
ncbi:MAG: radical SAM protein [Coriobacteriales bacterium]|nr:radical SAM protein [Coriobacteriales bacterium]